MSSTPDREALIKAVLDEAKTIDAEHDECGICIESAEKIITLVKQALSDNYKSMAIEAVKELLEMSDIYNSDGWNLAVHDAIEAIERKFSDE